MRTTAAAKPSESSVAIMRRAPLPAARRTAGAAAATAKMMTACSTSTISFGHHGVDREPALRQRAEEQRRRAPRRAGARAPSTRHGDAHEADAAGEAVLVVVLVAEHEVGADQAGERARRAPCARNCMRRTEMPPVAAAAGDAPTARSRKPARVRSSSHQARERDARAATKSDAFARRAVQRRRPARRAAAAAPRRRSARCGSCSRTNSVRADARP